MKSELGGLARRVADERIAAARYYAGLAVETKHVDWLAVYADGEVTFRADRPDHPDFVLAAPLTLETAKSPKTLRLALLAHAVKDGTP